MRFKSDNTFNTAIFDSIKSRIQKLNKDSKISDKKAKESE